MSVVTFPPYGRFLCGIVLFATPQIIAASILIANRYYRRRNYDSTMTMNLRKRKGRLSTSGRENACRGRGCNAVARGGVARAGMSIFDVFLFTMLICLDKLDVSVFWQFEPLFPLLDTYEYIVWVDSW